MTTETSVRTESAACEVVVAHLSNARVRQGPYHPVPVNVGRGGGGTAMLPFRYCPVYTSTNRMRGAAQAVQFTMCR